MKYLHVSKPLVQGFDPISKQPTLVVARQPGTTYRLPDSERARASARKDRREGFATARQQRKAVKAWRAEEKAEARLNAEIANHEANLTWQDERDEEREHYEATKYDDVA